MSYLSTYRSRLLASGNNQQESIVNTSKQTALNNFDSSLFTEAVIINGIAFNALITNGKTKDDKQLLLKPETKIDIGSIVTIANKDYLIMDFQGEGINEVYPKATLKLCNSTFPIESKKTKVIIGYNDFDEPIYETIEGEPILLPCIVEYTTLYTNTTEAINLPEGQINVTLQYTENECIAEGKEFTMYNTKYQIIGVDYTKSINKVGLITIKGKKVQ